MTTRILKYEIDPTKVMSITIFGDKITPLSVGVQNNNPYVWVAVTNGDDDDSPENTLMVCVACTGHRYADLSGTFLGTFQIGNFVGHVFCKVTE